MRTTITLDDDVAAAVEQLRRQQGLGLSQAVNDLVRGGLARKEPRQTYQHRSRALGLKIDVTNVSEAIDFIEGSKRV